MDAVIEIRSASRGGLEVFRAKIFREGRLIHECSPWRTQSACLEWALKAARQLYGIEAPTVRTGRQRV